MPDSPRRPTRRSFLSGRALVELVRDAAARAVEEGLLGHFLPDITCIHAARYAMGTTFTVTLPAGIPAASSLAMAALDLIQEIEDELTVYHEHSVISDVNRRAADEAVPVSEKLFDLLELCVELTSRTRGAFDVAAGAIVDAWGFVHGPRRVPSEEELARAVACSGSSHLILDREAKTVRFARKGVKLNFGSIGKGYALDRAFQLIQDQGGAPAGVIQGGKSSVLAWGRPAERARGWPVALGDPTGTNRRLGVVWLRDEGLATASNVIQFVDAEGRRYGHVLDPRTGWPADRVLQATAICPSAAEADALATAFFVLGEEGTRDYCERHPDTGAILVVSQKTGEVRVLPVGAVAEEALETVN